MMPTIMVVEDEPSILELLRINLVDAGYDVREAADAESAQRMLKESLPDLMLLDWMLPGLSGLAFAKQLRGDARTRELPVIMVTARTDEADKVAGLEAWVDDYVTKPFSPRELKARVKAVLRRRAPEAAQEVLEVGPMRLDPVTHRATVGGQARSTSGRRNFACCASFSRGPSASTRARNSSTRSGATRCTSRSAPSTSTSGGFVSRSSRTAATR